MPYQDPKVLVASPTYEGKDYIFKENWKAIKEINYKNFDYFYIDNSPTDSYYHKLVQRGAPVVRVPRGGNSRQALVNAQNWARKKAIVEGYDYLMFIESDLIPDKECINRLLAHNKFVVGSLYFLESKIEEKELPLYKFIQIKKVADSFGGFAEAKIEGDVAHVIDSKLRMPCLFFTYQLNNKEFATRLIKPHEVTDYYMKGLRKVHGVGFGCTLIKRDIFSKYMFWHDERFSDKHSDVYFYMELNNDGYPVYVDTNVVVPHHPSKWADVKDR